MSVITCVGCSENSETIYSTDSGRDWSVPGRKCPSWNVELNGNFFVRSIFVNLCHCLILCFWSHFVMLSFCCDSKHNAQANFFHALIFKTINLKTTERLKSIRIRKFKYDIFSIPFTVTSSETRRENEFFESKFELLDKKSPRGPNDLFDLNDFLNYGSSHYRSFLIRVY